MPAKTDLTLIEGNVETVRHTITQDDTGTPLNLTGLTIEFYLKPDASVPDSDPSVTKLTNPADITITDAVNGVCEVVVPAQAAGIRWRRLDVIQGGSRRTAAYGPLIVVNV